MEWKGRIFLFAQTQIDDILRMVKLGMERTRDGRNGEFAFLRGKIREQIKEMNKEYGAKWPDTFICEFSSDNEKREEAESILDAYRNGFCDITALILTRTETNDLLRLMMFAEAELTDKYYSELTVSVMWWRSYWDAETGGEDW